MLLNAINVPVQVVEPAQNVLFAANRIRVGCSIRHDIGSGLFTLTKPGVYKIDFDGNIIASVANQVAELAIEVAGEPIQSAASADTLTTIGDNASVALSALVRVPCGCCVSVSVGNISASNFGIENADIIIEKVA